MAEEKSPLSPDELAVEKIVDFIVKDLPRGETDDAIDHLHTHVEECERCRTQPFDMCPAGHELMVEAARKAGVAYSSLQPIKGEDDDSCL